MTRGTGLRPLQGGRSPLVRWQISVRFDIQLPAKMGVHPPEASGAPHQAGHTQHQANLHLSILWCDIMVLYHDSSHL